jgi:hypothetical protein
MSGSVAAVSSFVRHSVARTNWLEVATTSARISSKVRPLPMLNHVIREYRLPPGMRPPAAGSVLPKGVLAGLTSSEKMIAAAEAHCASLATSAEAKLEARRVTLIHETEAAVWDRALLLLGAMQDAREAVLEKAEGLMMSTVQAGLQCLLLDVRHKLQRRLEAMDEKFTLVIDELIESGEG